MTFLNPFALIALAAASFPLLFHLFAQRKARRIEFSSIRFLKQLEKSSMRKVKLRQILLLILRTLLIICLALAFSRPALRGSVAGFFGSSHANTTAIVLFDNSASMARRTASGSLFKQAQDAALRVSEALEDGDEVLLIPIASLERGKQYRRLHDPQEIRKAITELSISDAPAQLNDALRIASGELARSANVNKELYLISDNQASNLSSLKSGDSSLKLFDEKTTFFSLPIAGGPLTRNLSIDSLLPITTVFESGRPIEFSAFIRNTGESSVENAVVSLFYNDERVAQRSIASISPTKGESVTLSALPKNAGIMNVRAEVEEDGLPFDNKRYVSLDLPSTSKVAIFTNSPGDADYLKLSLEQTLSENGTMPYSIELHRLEELRMLPSLRSRLDAVFVEIGAGVIDPTDSRALHDYIASGKSAAIFPLAGITPQQFNASASVIGLPQLLSLEGSLSGGATYASIANFDLAHPFFRGMFDDKSNPNTRGIESPKIYQYYKFAASGEPLIKLSTGVSLLSDSKIGKGTALLFSIPPTFSFSDLPRKQIFLPLMRRSAAYLSSSGAGEEFAAAKFFAGQAADVQLPIGIGVQPGERLLIKGPNAMAERLEVKGAANGTLHIELEQTPYAGIYTIYKDAESQAAISAVAINPPTIESNLQSASASDIQTVLKSTGIASSSYHSIDPDRKDISELVRQSRFGTELWQLFLAIAVACAVAEMLVAREGKSVNNN
jgi:hypothetical protein